MLNIERDNRSLFSSRDRNSQLSIMHRLKNVLFIKLNIEVYCNDIDCLEYRLSRIFLLRLQLSKMMMTQLDLLMNRQMLIEVTRCEKYCEFSLMLKDLVDKHFLIFL